ncbi:MAG TPA: ABC transporter substrate-binding protein, partial [Symbiobacteriaceae bacterium]|nr:ABC transporter substrate-binding protein [Symbiobacteriaceae bacterium]
GQIDELTLESNQVTDQIRKKNVAVEYDRNGWGYFTLNTEGPHLSNKLVRQALTHAMDRGLITRKLFGPLAKVPVGPIPSVSWAYDQNLKPLSHDSVKAIELLEEAGYKLNGRGIYEKDGEPLSLRLGITDSPVLRNIASYVFVQYALIGIQVIIEPKSFAELQTDMAAGDFDMVYTGFSLSLDPDSLYALFHSSQFGAFNRSRYSNARVDELLEAGRREADPAKRKEIYAGVQQQLIEDAPVILLVSQHYTDWVSKKVKGGVRNFPGSGASDYHLWWIFEQ